MFPARVLFASMTILAATTVVADINGIGTPVPLKVPANIYDLTIGPDGNIWGVTAKGNIGRVMPDGSYNEIALPWGTDQFNIPYAQSITSGGSGSAWVSGTNGRVAHVSPSGSVTDFGYATAGVLTSRIVTGADGAAWLYQRLAPGPGTLGSPNWKMTRVDVYGQSTSYDLGTSGDSLSGLVSGGDGSLWFIDDTRGQLMKFSLVTKSVAGRYAIPSPSNKSGDDHMALAWDGNVWFTRGSSLDRATPDGTITEFRLPSGAQTGGIVMGGDGNLWFTEPSAGKLGELVMSSITSAGSATINESGVIASNFYDLFLLPQSFSTTAAARASAHASDASSTSCEVTYGAYFEGQYLSFTLNYPPPCTLTSDKVDWAFVFQAANQFGIQVQSGPTGSSAKARKPGDPSVLDAPAAMTTVVNISAAPGASISNVTTNDPAASISFSGLKATISTSLASIATKVTLSSPPGNHFGPISGAAVLSSAGSDPDPRDHVASFFADDGAFGRSVSPPTTSNPVTTPVKRGK